MTKTKIRTNRPAIGFAAAGKVPPLEYFFDLTVTSLDDLYQVPSHPSEAFHAQLLSENPRRDDPYPRLETGYAMPLVLQIDAVGR